MGCWLTEGGDAREIREHPRRAVVSPAGSKGTAPRPNRQPSRRSDITCHRVLSSTCFPALLVDVLAVAAVALAALWPLDLAAVDVLWPNFVNIGILRPWGTAPLDRVRSARVTHSWNRSKARAGKKYSRGAHPPTTAPPRTHSLAWDTEPTRPPAWTTPEAASRPPLAPSPTSTWTRNPRSPPIGAHYRFQGMLGSGADWPARATSRAPRTWDCANSAHRSLCLLITHAQHTTLAELSAQV